MSGREGTMMDGMMGMMHGWMWLVLLLLLVILAAVLFLLFRSGRGKTASVVLLAAASLNMACDGRTASLSSPEAVGRPAGTPAGSPVAGGAEVKSYEIRGRIAAIAEDRRTVTLDHEEVPGLMPAMKMDYRVDDAAVLRGLAAGDQVHGRFDVRPGPQYVVTSLSK